MSNILLVSRCVRVRALTVFLSVLPVARVEVFIVVAHYAFTVALAVLPVAVVVAGAGVGLFADAVAEVVEPCAGVDAFVCAFFSVGLVSVLALTVSFLKRVLVLSVILELTPLTKSPL